MNDFLQSQSQSFELKELLNNELKQYKNTKCYLIVQHNISVGFSFTSSVANREPTITSYNVRHTIKVVEFINKDKYKLFINV